MKATHSSIGRALSWLFLLEDRRFKPSLNGGDAACEIGSDDPAPPSATAPLGAVTKPEKSTSLGAQGPAIEGHSCHLQPDPAKSDAGVGGAAGGEKGSYH